MVAIVTGAGLGLLDSSANQVNGLGIVGNNKAGQAKGSSYVNVATGNLILQFADETLSGTGADISHARTYNSLGTTTDGDNDRWRWLGEKRIRLHGSLNASGSYLIRTTGDGHESRYNWTGSYYESSDGKGAHDRAIRSGSEWVWTEGSSRTVERYNASTGWIKNVRDTSGNGFDYSFSGNLLTQIRDVRSGQLMILGYSGGRLAHVDTRATTSASSSSLGSSVRQVYYSYDSSGRLTQVRTDLSENNSISDNNVYTTNYYYDGSSTRIRQISQSDGTTVNFTYISSGGVYKVRTVTDQTGTTTFSYVNGRTDVTNGAGDTWSYTYDSSQRVTRVESEAVDGSRQTATFAYDSKDNVTRVTDAAGKSIYHSYDSRGNLTQTRDVLGNYIRYTYDSNNKVVQETRYKTPSTSGSPSNGETTYYIYDSKQRLRYTLSPEGRVSENRYNSTTGLLAYVIKYAGGTYNPASLSSTTSAREGQLNTWVGSQNDTKTEQTRYDYDYRGNMLKKTEYANVSSTGTGSLDTRATVTEYVYSAHGQLLQTINVTGSSRTTKKTITSNVYDGLGRLTSVASANGTTTTSYSSGSIAVSNSASGVTATSAFDSRGKLISVSQSASGESTRTQRYYYDAAGRIVMSEDAEGARNYTFYDAAGRVRSEIDASGAVKEYRYDEAGRVTSEVRFANKVNTSTWFNGTAVTRSSITVTAHADDRQKRYIYDSMGRVTYVTDEFGSNDRTINTRYDGVGRVTQTDEGGRVTRFFYSKDGLLVGTLNARYNLTENIYDDAGRLIRIVRYKNTVSSTYRTSTDFNAVRNNVSSGEKLFTHYYYDAQGRQVGMVNEQGFFTETIYEPANKRVITRQYMGIVPSTLSVTSSISSARVSGGYRTTTTNFDDYGRVVTEVGHDGTTNRTIYDAAGRVVKTVLAEGRDETRATRTRYNAFGDVTGIVSGVGEAAYSSLTTAIDQYGKNITVNKLGQQIEVEGPQSQRTLFFYDDANRLVYTVNGEGNLVKTSYNTFGEVSETRSYNHRFSTTMTAGNVSYVSSEASRYGSSSDAIVSSTYNQLGLIKNTTNAESAVTSFQYDRHGDLISETSSAAQPYYGTSSASTQTQYTYDALGQLTRTIEDAGGIAATTNTLYDGFNRVYRIQDANNGYSYKYYYDQGRRVRTRDADVRYTTEIFDALGRVKESHDGYSKITRFSYDDTNRLVVRTSAEGVVSRTWRNRVGEVIRTQDGNGNNTYFTYTKDGNLDVTEDAKGYTTDNNYDRSGRLTSTRNANNNTIYYAYDRADRVTTTSGATVYTVNTYDGMGRLTRKVEGSGSDAVRTDYEYDRVGRLKREIMDPSGLRLSKRYTYSAAGEVAQIETGTTTNQSQHVVRYRYDNLGRKTHENVDPTGLNLETRFYYNKAGQITRTVTENGSADVSVWTIYNKTGQKRYEINGLGEVTKFNYDSNGRLFETYQYYNRLTSSSLNALGNSPSSVSLPSTNAQDRRDFTIYDDDGMERFTLTATDVNQWVATENVYDDNGNIIETRRFDKVLPLTESRVNSLDNSSITDSEMIIELRALGYRFNNWGDSSTVASGTRRTHFAFDSLNRLRYTVSATNAITENVYDAMGNVRYQTQFYSTPSISDYTESGISARLTSTYRNNSQNRTKEFQYDTYNRLIREFSATAEKIHYWSGSNLYSRDNARIRTYTTYDSLGRVKSREEGRIVNSSGSTITSSYTRTTNYTYDKAGRQIKSELAGYYDAADGKVYKYSASDRFRRSTEVVYDAMGNAVRNKIRTGLSTYVYQYKTYDGANRLVHEIDGLNYITKYSYDKASNKTETRRYYYTFNTSTYRDAGEYIQASAITTSTSSSRLIKHTYDKAGRVTRNEVLGAQQNFNTSKTSSSTPNYGIGSYDYDDTMITNFTYNAFGEQVLKSEQIDNTGRWADSYTYFDRLGREVMAVDAEKYGSKMEYDALGNLTRTTEYADKTSSSLSIHSKPSFSSSSYSQASADRILSYYYDKMGRNTGVRRHNFRYSDHSSGSSYSTRSYSATGYGDSIQSTVYNKFGEVTSVTDGDGNIISHQYNNLGQVTRTYEPYRYIGNSNGTSTSNGRPYTSYSYDVFGNVLQEDAYATAGASKHHYTRHEYDAAGFETRKYVLWSGGSAAQDLRIKNDSAGHVIEEKQAVSVSGTHGYSHDVLTRYHYDVTGRQIATVNVFNGRQSGDYKRFNAFGDVTHSYKVRGSSATALTSLTRTTEQYFYYDNAGRVRYMRDASGYNYYYYDLRGNVTRHELRGYSTSTSDMRVTESYYDELNRAVTRRSPRYLVENYNLSTTSTGASTATTQTPKTTQTYDRWGNVISRTTAGDTTSYQYNHDSKVVYEKGPSVYAWTGTSTSTSSGRYYAAITHLMDYDLQGNLVKDRYEARSGSTLKRSKTSTNVFNRAGQLIKTYDATNKTKEATYDMLGNKVSTKSGTGTVHVLEYNALGQTTKRSVMRGSTKVRLSEYRYDQAGRQYQDMDAFGNAIHNKYDARGKLVQSINRNGGKMTYTYDDLGNKTKEVEDHGYTYTTTHYQPYGGSTTTTHNVNINFEREWTYSMSSYYIGRVATHTGGHLSTASGAKYTYSYNRFGELSAETYSSTRKIEYGYLANGLRASVKETNGTSTSEAYFGYDIKGNRTREKYSASRQVTTYTMSGTSYGSVTTSTNTVKSGSTTYYQYDDLNRLTKVKAPRGTFYSGSTQYTADLKLMEYRYDEWGNRRAIYVNYKVGSSTRSDTDWFDYDNEGRVTVDSGFISGGRVVVGKSGGTAITYDNDGRRATTEKWQGTTNGQWVGGYGGSSGTYIPGYERFQQERFTYNDLGALASAQKRTVRRDTGDNSGDSYYSATGYSTYETNTYDNRGFKTRSIYNGNRTDNTYNAGGLVTYSATYDSQNRRTGITDTYKYDRTGMLRGYRYRYYDKGTYKFSNTYTYENNATFSSYQNTAIKLNSTQASTKEGVTNNSYDFRGRLVQSTITQRYKSQNKTGLTYRYFIYDTDGQIIASRERHAGESSYKVQSYFYQGANSLANFGDLGAHYNPISSIHKGGNSATSYSVNEGDTLSSIAQMIYGDASLWYVIAEANGLSMSPVDRFGSTDAGRSLRIPNSDQSIKNNSTTFKPYNPGEIIGDLTPDAKIVPPPPPKKGGCSKLAMVIMVVVAVVVTVVTAGAAAAAIAAAAPALAGTAATMAGAFIGGVVGSLASQATGMALGVVDGISLRQAFASGLTGAFTAGIGAALSSGGSALATTANGVTKLTTLGHALQGAGSVAAGALANKIAGLDSGFSWRAVAAGAVAGAITGSLGLNDNNAKTGNVKSGKFLSAFGKSFASSAINGVVNRAFSKGPKKSYGDIALDSFGNALGSGLAAHFELRKKAEAFGDKLGRKWAAKADTQDVAAMQASMQSARDKMNKEIEAQNNKRINEAVEKSVAETSDAINEQQSAKVKQSVANKHEETRTDMSTKIAEGALAAEQAADEFASSLDAKREAHGISREASTTGSMDAEEVKNAASQKVANTSKTAPAAAAGPKKGSVEEFISLVKKIEQLYPDYSFDDVNSALRGLTNTGNGNFQGLFGRSGPVPDLSLLPQADKDRIIALGDHSPTNATTEYGIGEDGLGNQVALSHVLTGIQGGLNHRPKHDFTVQKLGTVVGGVGSYVFGAGEFVDNIMAATLAGDLGQSAILVETEFNQSGSYTGNLISDAATAELVGDIDGLIMGNYLSDLDPTTRDTYFQASGPKLSEFLEGYYDVSNSSGASLNISNRRTNFDSLITRDYLVDQTQRFATNYRYLKSGKVSGYFSFEGSHPEKAVDSFYNWYNNGGFKE